mmetsp:Transcript_31532/g.79172  ORF Transcript_31532/g.79172 Transcript_31532/m.79172 type:complete len:340 (+) Transcript_31532:2046-3065(+)
MRYISTALPTVCTPSMPLPPRSNRTVAARLPSARATYPMGVRSSDASAMLATSCAFVSCRCSSPLTRVAPAAIFANIFPFSFLPWAPSASASSSGSSSEPSPSLSSSLRPVLSSADWDSPPVTANRCRRSSAVPTASRRPCGSTSRLQHSAPTPARVCAQCCVSKSHTRTVPSLLHVTSRAPAATPAPAPPPARASLPPPLPPGPPPTPGLDSTNTASVTWSLCPRSRHSPASATTSHTTTLVSLPPETSSVPPALKRSAVTSERCPLRSTSVEPSLRFHRRIDPSDAPAATRSVPSARAMRVTAGVAPPSRGGGTRLRASTPRRTSHTASRSRAAVTR